jgi:cyclopropane fatty-acyl-phospholipid synthase-like methyltransferase
MSSHTKYINQLITKYDNKRQKFLEKKDYKSFRKTYSKSFDIKNENTDSYWSVLFGAKSDLKKQSPMTKEKIKIISNLIPQKPIEILDLGIGQGFVEELLVKQYKNYSLNGIDISRTSIKRAKQLFNGSFLHENVLNIDKHYQANSFDVILAIELLEHISPSRLFAFYKKIFSLLRKNGRFILSIPINEHLEFMDSNPSAHVRSYTFKIIEKELNLNGFIVEQKKYLYAFNKRYHIKTILSKLLKNRWEPNSLVIVAKKAPKNGKIKL